MVLPLSGTEKGERDSTVLVVLARLDGEPCLVVGQDRSRQGPAKPMGPGALRTARRAMRLANEMRLPLVTVIDTPGAELSQRAEEGAIAGEIARCLASLATMTVPTVSVVLGQGCGGGALALLPAKRVIVAEKAWLMPLPPEGASVIVHGDTAHAAEQARGMRVRAVDLLAHGTAHHVVPEPDGDTGEALAEAVAAEIARRDPAEPSLTATDSTASPEPAPPESYPHDCDARRGGRDRPRAGGRIPTAGMSCASSTVIGGRRTSVTTGRTASTSPAVR